MSQPAISRSQSDQDQSVRSALPQGMSPQEIISLCKDHTLFSWSAQAAISPIPMSRALGVYFWDAWGKRYLDLYSQLVCTNIGHGDPRVIAAIKQQADRLLFASSGMATDVRAALGHKLCTLTEGRLRKTFFTVGGADANEYAIRIARAVTGRHKIVTHYRSYHGGTAGAGTLTGDSRRFALEPGIPGVCRVLNPYAYRCGFCRDQPGCTRACLGHVEEVIQHEGPGNVAAVMLETVTGGNGVIIPPPGYLAGVRELCDRHGILMILDEVLTGFGRTGTWFAWQHWGVVPDIMTLAKGLTSASLPLGAVMMTERVAAHFDTNVFYGGLTYNSHPMALAAALATIQVYEEDDLIRNSAQVGLVLANELKRIMGRHRSVGDVRSIGLLGVIELVKSRETRAAFAGADGGEQTAEMNRINGFIREHGVYTFTRWNYLFICPPLCITANELLEGLAVVDAALDIADRSL
jgi:taurine--2-oxoglutarate transaminase